ncbi:hypothetical protein ACE6H2_001933 [Prunus campanulata]
MAEDMDSDTCVGFKRTIKEIQETPTLTQRSNSPSAAIPEQDSHSSEIDSPLKQDSDFTDKSPPCSVSDSSKKVKLSPHGQVSETHLEEIQEMPNYVSGKAEACGLISGLTVSDGVTQNFMEICEMGLVSDSEFVKTETEQTPDDEKERVVSDLVDKKGEGSVISEVGFADIEKFMQETKSVTELDCKEGVDASLSTSVENKVVFVGKEAESQSSLELKKKQLLEEVEAILVPAEKTLVQSGTDGCLSSFNIEVIDDTAMISLLGNGCGKELGFLGPAKCVAQGNGNKNAKKEMNGKIKARTSGRKEKVANHLVEAHSVSLKKGKGTKIFYSRMELEAMMYVNVVEQKKLWKDIYRGLGPVVAKEYENLASVKHQKNIRNNFEPHKLFEKMEVPPGTLGEAFSENVDIELENLVNNQTQDASSLDPFCSYSATDENGYPFPEKECSEDDDSDEDYASIQRPAFVVEGEPNFDSGSPEDGLEYLRRVRWEAARIPKVRVAKLDRSKFNIEQSDYMPKIPEIAKCPEQLLPLKQWEDAFLAEFSELRLALPRFEGYNASTSLDPQSKNLLHDSHQLPGSIVFEKFANVKSKEIDIHWPRDCLGSSIDQLSLSTTEGSNASLPAENFSPKSHVSQSSSDSPLLSVILPMDSVARVSMLRKRINAIEAMSTLSRNDCLWLFSLCAVVDTPLDADTSASLRSLLRRCAALRAAKYVLDDEVVMLNILATISGRYFGQSEN